MLKKQKDFVKNNWYIWLTLGVCTIVLQLFCSVDSYLYFQYGQFDSAVFFMGGKALMNGMIPYVDFTDSKGVLLWFIFGLGYLLDHYSYIGIFWIMSVVIFLTLYISYRTACLFLEKRYSLISALFLLLPLLYWNFYFETKAEHICWPAVAWGVYLLMKSIVGNPIYSRDYVALGVCVVACLMIKWSIAVMMLSFLACLCWLAWEKKSLKNCILYCVLGGIVAFVPFAIFFTWEGNWQDMWREYFVNTLTTVSPGEETSKSLLLMLVNRWRLLFTTRMFLYFLYLLPVLDLWRRERRFNTLMPVLCGLFFLLLSTCADNAFYYVSVAGPFAIMTIVVIIQRVSINQKVVRFMPIVFLLGAGYIVWGSIHYSPYFCTKEKNYFNQYMAISAVMDLVEAPQTLITVGQDPGLCIGTTLPGTRYWTLQKGRTEEMWLEEYEDIKKGVADFIVFRWNNPNDYRDELLNAGYRYLGNYSDVFVYTKRDIVMPNEIIDIPIKDIISKRTYKDIYEKSLDTHTMLQ